MLSLYWNPKTLRFLRAHDALFVVASHESGSSGRVVGLVRGRDGSWLGEPVAELPGDPFAWTVDNGDLVLLVRNPEEGPPSAPTTQTYVLRLTASLKLEAVE